MGADVHDEGPFLTSIIYCKSDPLDVTKVFPHSNRMSNSGLRPSQVGLSRTRFEHEPP